MASSLGIAVGSISEEEERAEGPPPQTCALYSTWILRPKRTGTMSEGFWVPLTSALDGSTCFTQGTHFEDAPSMHVASVQLRRMSGKMCLRQGTRPQEVWDVLCVYM